MNWGTVGTVVGAIIAVVIAWFVVDLMLSAMWFMFRLGAVVIVGVIIYFVLRHLFRRRVRDED